MKKFEELGLVTKAPNGIWHDSGGTVVHGIYHEILKRTGHLVVFLDGRRMAEYIFPRVQQKFASPLLNDYNLHFTGGWVWNGADNRALVERVIHGQKPAGFIKGDLALLKGFEMMAKNARLATHLHADGNQFELGIARQGTCAETFDLDALERDYNNMGIIVSVKQYATMKLSDFLLDWDSTSPSDEPTHAAITGLLLGYPVESTVALLTGNVLPRYRGP